VHRCVHSLPSRHMLDDASRDEHTLYVVISKACDVCIAGQQAEHCKMLHNCLTLLGLCTIYLDLPQSQTLLRSSYQQFAVHEKQHIVCCIFSTSCSLYAAHYVLHLKASLPNLSVRASSLKITAFWALSGCFTMREALSIKKAWT